MSDNTTRYAELYWYYRDYFVDYQKSHELPVHEDAAHAYGVEHAARVFISENGTPPAADVRPLRPGAAPALAEAAPVAPVEAAVAHATTAAAPPQQVEAAHVAEPAHAAHPVEAVQPAQHDGGAHPVVPAVPVSPFAGATGAPTSPPSAVAPEALATGASDSSSPKRPRRTAIVVGAISGVLVLALIAAAIVVLPQLFRGGGSAARLDDVSAEPSVGWTYGTGASPDDYNADAIFTQLAGGRVLVVSPFDHYAWSQGNDTGKVGLVDWYDGVDADYQAGWDASTAYQAAVDAVWEDFSRPFPEREDFFPAEFEGIDPSDATFDEPNAGAFAGWYDGYLGDEFGESLPTKPVIPDDTSMIAVIDGGSGEEIWSVGIGDVLPDHVPSDTFSVVPVGDGAQLAVYSYGFSPRGSERTSSVAVLDARTGEVQASSELEGLLSSGAVAGDVLVAAMFEETGSGDFETVIFPIPLADLDAEPAWSETVDAEDSPFVGRFSDDVVRVTTYNGDDSVSHEYLDVTSGDEVPWSDGRLVLALGDARLAIDQVDDDISEISALSADGKDLWSIESALYRVVDGVLFVWEDCTSGSCEDMAPVDLATGEPRWKKTVDDVFPVVIEGDRVLVQRIDDGDPERQLEWLSMGSGESVDADAPKLPAGVDVVSARPGQSMMFLTDDDELVAYSYTAARALWSFDLDDDEKVQIIGTRLHVWNEVEGELSRLIAQ